MANMPGSPSAEQKYYVSPEPPDESGIFVGLIWIDSNSSPLDMYICSSIGPVVWSLRATGGSPSDADYLVGTAHADLSAEIVVGTVPGGELGGTWAAPTVDATHSGSTHHTQGSDPNDHAQSHDHAAAGDGQTLTPATLNIPSSVTPAQTAEGQAVWDSDGDFLTVGDGVGRKQLMNVGDAPTAHTLASHSSEAHSELTGVGSADHHGDNAHAGLILSGIIAARPAFGTLDRYYWATDENILYHDTGAAWEKAAVADHADLNVIGTDDHHAQAHNLDSHAVRTHANLQSVGASDHHAKYLDSEAITAIEGEPTLDLTGRISFDKGADIASAATITPGTDGNYFDITGTVGITAIAGLRAGTVIIFQFDAVLTITHDVTKIILQGSANFTSAAGDVMAFISQDGTVWRELWRRLASASGGSGAPTTADYLVGTANAGLSAEIVVGTTPGGELGGTWAAPTVDAIHSGSAHVAQSVQSNIEAESNNDTYMPPDLAHYGPWAVKAAVHINLDGTFRSGAFNYNITSITDNAVGKRTIVFDEDFSNLNNHGSVATLQRENGDESNIAFQTEAVGSVDLVIQDDAANFIDKATYSITVGDHV